MARKSEGFRVLESELRRSIVTVPKPGGMVSWSNTQLPRKANLIDLQSLELSSLTSSPAGAAVGGLNLFVQPEHDARLSLVAPVTLPPSPSKSTGTSNGSIKTPATNSDVSSIEQGSQVPQHQAPLWVKAAVKMGAQFVRLAAASRPALIPNSYYRKDFRPCSDCGGIHALVVGEFYFWLGPACWYNDNDIVH